MNRRSYTVAKGSGLHLPFEAAKDFVCAKLLTPPMPKTKTESPDHLKPIPPKPKPMNPIP